MSVQESNKFYRLSTRPYYFFVSWNGRKILEYERESKQEKNKQNLEESSNRETFECHLIRVMFFDYI